MIKDSFEFLFVVASGRIGMVRRDAVGFTVIHVSEDGDPMTDFSNPDEYWDQWKELTNFLDSSSEVDFAFLSDKKDVKLVSDERRKQDNFKRVEESVWSLSVVEQALRSVAGELRLTQPIDVVEGNKKVFSTGGDASKRMHLMRFGKVHDDPTPVIVAPVKTQPKEDPPPKPKHPQPIKKLPADCLGNDERAQALKVGDVISGVVKTISPLRNKCFVDSGSLSEQLRMRYTDLTAYYESVKRPVPKEGDNIELKVLSVVKTSQLINLGVEVID